MPLPGIEISCVILSVSAGVQCSIESNLTMLQPAGGSHLMPNHGISKSRILAITFQQGSDSLPKLRPV